MPSQTLRAGFVASLCVLVTASGCSPQTSSASSSQGPGAAPVLFEGARIIVGDGTEPIERGAFVVENGTIREVGRQDAVRLPAGGTRVDLTGKTVMPALVSAHVHIGLLEGASFGPQHYTRDVIVDHLRRYAYHGVTAVLTAGTDVGPLSFEIRDHPPLDAARLLTSGRGMASPDGGPGFPAIAHTSFPITTVDEGRARVRELAAQGANAVKIWVDDRNGRVKKLTPDLYRPIIDEAHAHRMMALAHVYYLRDAHELVDAGIDGFLHLVRDAVMDDALVARMKARNVFAAPNLGGTHRATLQQLAAPSLELLRESLPGSVIDAYTASLDARDPEAVAAARATYARMAQSVAKLTAAGVTLVLGGDTGIPNAWHGWAEQYELARMVEAGMSPAQAIVAATSAPARILGLHDLGTLETGKSADFLVLDANPLEAIANASRLSSVYLRGRPLDRAALRARWVASRP